MKLYAISLKEDGCDYKSAAEARRGLLNNDSFRMVPTGFDIPCSAIHAMHWDKRTAAELPDKTLVTIKFRHRYCSQSHQITVQLGRCIICGDRVDLGKSPACFSEYCQAAYKKQLRAEGGCATKGAGQAVRDKIKKLMETMTEEEIIALVTSKVKDRAKEKG